MLKLFSLIDTNFELNFLCYRKKQFEAAFETLKQEDSDGGQCYIPVHALRKLLTSKGEIMEEDEVKELISDMDADNDGKIEHEEFMQALIPK